MVDSHASLSPHSQLACTARAAPVLVAVSDTADAASCAALTASGCEILRLPGTDPASRLLALCDELGQRGMTNILAEGGSQLLGSLLDAGQIDEVHVFIAPRIIGGQTALSPIAGHGIRQLAHALQLEEPLSEQCGHDLHVHGRVLRGDPPASSG